MLYKMLFDMCSLIYFHKLVGNYKLIAYKYIHIHKMGFDLLDKLVNLEFVVVKLFFSIFSIS